MENFKIGDKICFKDYVKFHYNSEYYKSFKLDLFDEHVINGIKGSIIEIKGRKVHNSFIKKVSFRVGDKVLYLNKPEICEIVELYGLTCTLKMTPLLKYNGVSLTDIKLVNMEKERVIKAANTSKEAYDLLKELYPDYFEDEKYFDLSKERLTDWVGKLNIGNFAYKSFYLSEKCNWEISQDEQGRSILIPTKK